MDGINNNNNKKIQPMNEIDTRWIQIRNLLSNFGSIFSFLLGNDGWDWVLSGTNLKWENHTPPLIFGLIPFTSHLCQRV